MKTTTIMWFRQDLRLTDNPAISYACGSGSVLPVYIFDETDRKLGGASKWWVHRSLQELKKVLPGLTIMAGNPAELIKQLVLEAQANSVVWNRIYEPHAISRDKHIKAWLQDQGYEGRSFPGSYLKEPWKLKTGAGGPYKVFTPFWKALSATEIDRPLKATETFDIVDHPNSGAVQSFNPHWATRWGEIWAPGEAGAKQALERFLNEGLRGYGELRNRPDLPNVSRLSPHLHFGEISPRQIWASVNFLIIRSPSFESTQTSSCVKWSGGSFPIIYCFISQTWWTRIGSKLLTTIPGEKIPMI